MPFSHHSHSGQFCHHAKDTLEEVVQTAIAKKMSVLALTEHMPREKRDLYPEEIRDSITPRALADTFAAYYKEARRLQSEYAPLIHILVGVEVDWIHSDSSITFIKQLKRDYDFDLLVGGVHHVHAVPTDYDRETYLQARYTSNSERRTTFKDIEKAGIFEGNDDEIHYAKGDELLFKDYLDHQYTMLLSIRPDIVAHFDVIRLWSDEPNSSFRRWPRVWDRVVRNLKSVKEYGGVIEVNSAGLRKGMAEPYPGGEICREFLAMGGQFTLSDDSHGIAQVATHYAQTMTFLQRNGIDELIYFEKTATESSPLGDATSNPRTTKKPVSVKDLRETHPFFS